MIGPKPQRRRAGASPDNAREPAFSAHIAMCVQVVCELSWRSLQFRFGRAGGPARARSPPSLSRSPNARKATRGEIMARRRLRRLAFRAAKRLISGAAGQRSVTGALTHWPEMTLNDANNPILELLGNADLFRTLAAPDLAACAASFREARYGKGEMLFARGDPGTHLYVIAEGQVRLAIATDEGRELSFQVAGAGDLFGEIALLDGWPRSAEATALTPTTAYLLARADFQRLRAVRPAISDAVVSFLCQRLRNVSD